MSLIFRCSFFPPSCFERFWNCFPGESVGLPWCVVAEVSCELLSLKSGTSALLILARLWLSEIRALARLSDAEGLARKPCWLSADVGGSHQTPGFVSPVSPFLWGLILKWIQNLVRIVQDYLWYFAPFRTHALRGKFIKNVNIYATFQH